MFWYQWTSAEVAHPIIGEDKEMETGDKEGDPLQEEMYLLQDTGVLLDASTVEKKGIMCTTAPRRNSYPTMKETISKPTSSIYKMKRNKINAMTTKCMTSKKPTQ